MSQNDPYRSYNFKLEIGGITEAEFTECSGLGAKLESSPLRRIPGPVDYTPVTLKYGVTKSRDLWDWMMKTAAGEVQRRDVSILLLDSGGDNEVMRWNLKDAWPSEWQGSALSASDKSVAIETLTLVYDSLERA